MTYHHPLSPVKYWREWLIGAAIALLYLIADAYSQTAESVVAAAAAVAEAGETELPDLPDEPQTKPPASLTWEVESSETAAAVLEFGTAEGWFCPPCKTQKDILDRSSDGLVYRTRGVVAGDLAPDGTAERVPYWRLPNGATLRGAQQVPAVIAWAKSQGFDVTQAAKTTEAVAVVRGVSTFADQLAAVEESLVVHLNSHAKQSTEPQAFSDWRPGISVDVPDSVPELLQRLLSGQTAEFGRVRLDWSGERTLKVKPGRIEFEPAVSVRVSVVAAELQAVEVSDNGRELLLVLGSMVDLKVKLE